MKNKALWVILALILIISATYIYYISHISYPINPPYDPNYAHIVGLEWYRSLDKGSCAKFQSNTLAKPQVTKILKEEYVLVAVYLDIDREVARKYNVSYPPYVLLLDKNDNVLERVAGVDADTFLPIVAQPRNKTRNR